MDTPSNCCDSDLLQDYDGLISPECNKQNNYKHKIDNYTRNTDSLLKSKIQKLNDTSGYYTKVVDDWISEYKKWYESSFEKDICKLTTTVNEFKKQRYNKIYNTTNYIPQYTITNPTNNLNIQLNQTLNEQLILSNNQSRFVNFTTVNNNNARTKPNVKNVGYWGPLLRYGTYGIYKMYDNNIILRKRKEINVDEATNDLFLKESILFPLDTPLCIKIPRQAMICTLQLHAQFKLSDLKKLENDPLLHMGINYSASLEQVTNKCGTCPKYLFSKVSNIPPIEREYFTDLKENKEVCSFLSLDCSRRCDIESIQEFYACELFISDILISQGFALWKRRALETCARKAFKVLENHCYLVGSTRYWRHSDFLAACVTEDPQIVPKLPPFFTDPTEPLYKKDVKINKSDPIENFDVLNPKPINDFWLYAPTLLSKSSIKNLDPQILLYQSAEFSQMNVSFEIETCFDESFSCTIFIDKSAAVTVKGLGSLEQARQAASLVLVDKLLDSQPIIALHQSYHDNYNDILLRNKQFRDNHFLIHSLMWTQDDISTAIPFTDISDIIKSELIFLNENFRNVSSKDVVEDSDILIHFLTSFAQSSLINPLIMNAANMTEPLWHSLVEIARQAGLLVLNDHLNGEDNIVLLCKQVPHKKMKAILLEKGELGVFRLLCQGTLSEKYLSELKGYLCNESSSDEFISEESLLLQDVTFTNTSKQLDVLSTSRRDIKHGRIPGLDF